MVFLRPLSLDCLGNTKEEERRGGTSLRVYKKGGRSRKKPVVQEEGRQQERGNGRKEGQRTFAPPPALSPSVDHEEAPSYSGKEITKYNYI